MIAIRRTSIVLVLIHTSIALSQGTVPREEAQDPLPPLESLQKFKVAKGLSIGLVAAEPHISQPLSISFDDRGRMWVLQYKQFPNPNGLKPVKVDNWLRTIYDKVPPPPPRGPKGNDRISICSDTDGDGRIDKVKHFLSNLNLASGMALGYEGVFVAQPPYLLFYADRNHDDVPDGDPEVLLQGFGMNDAHAFANSLTWGPDGWLYGAQGSTATANIRGIGFQQGVWRYHPPTKRFELFAEGGGNTWGIDFDPFGNLFAGGNTVEPLVHHVQGAYYVKGFGKHGPLHNPHAYGYFQPVRHHGYTGDSLTGGFVLYQGGAFPARFHGACIAPNTRHSASRWSTLEQRGTSFATRHAGDFITTSDKWFRPIESTVGPDGALYVADWYDYNISHSSPKNRSKWYQPSRLDGRVWRVAPPGLPKIAATKFNLQAETSHQLLRYLSHKNAWYSRQAQRILMERRDRSVVPQLLRLLQDKDQRLALQGLWTLHLVGGLTEERSVRLLTHKHEYVRAWTIRLLGDRRQVSPRMASLLEARATHDSSPIVRSQLACTAKRLPGPTALRIATQLITHDQDAGDVHIPLLIWWAIEDKAISHANQALAIFHSPGSWRYKIARRFIIERLARRFVADNSQVGAAACAKLLRMSIIHRSSDLVLAGMSAALTGQKLTVKHAGLTNLVTELARQKPTVRLIELGLRMGAKPNVALAFIRDSKRPAAQRAQLIRTLGEIQLAAAAPELLELLSRTKSTSIQRAVLAALGYFKSKAIGQHVLAKYNTFRPSVRSQAIDLLSGRRAWAQLALNAVVAKAIPAKDISMNQLKRMRLHDDKEINRIIDKRWGRIAKATSLEKRGRITAILQMLGRRSGNKVRGFKLFQKNCANCHKLHGKGTTIGPDLTGAERRDRTKLVHNIVDPGAVIRPQFATHLAVTRDGRVLTGLLAASTPQTVTILDAKNRRTILPRANLRALKESPGSLMPDNLLQKLTDQQIRDLIAYIQSK